MKQQTKIEETSEDWESSTIADALEINPQRELKKGTNAKAVAMQDIKEFNKKIQNFTLKPFKGGSKFKNGDTLMARITPCLENGKTAFVDILNDKETGFGSTEFIVLSGKEGKTINEFVYYLAISPKLRADAIQSMTGTSGRQRVQNDLLGSKEILIPLLNEQQSISKILSDLDAKIELNQKMNKTLEAIGQALFKYWFVDFEFPNDKGKPYKSSGGEMVDSELGEIPKGWKVGRLGDYIFVERGLSYKGSGLCEEGIPMVNLGNIAPNNIFRYEGLKYYNGEFKERNLIKPNDLIIANTDITQKREVLGSCLIIPSDLGNDKILFTHHIYAVRFLDKNETLPKHFLSYLLQTQEYRERAEGFATGTTVLALPEDAILKFNFVLPERSVLTKFDKLMSYIKDKSAKNIIESKNLSQIRDSLLPQLMSGKIRVPIKNEK